MFAPEILTLFLFVPVSRALVISISSSVTIDQPTPLTWARTPGEAISFELYLKGDIMQEFTFLDKVDVDANALNGTTNVIISGFQPTTYSIVAFFTIDLEPSFFSRADASTDPFSLSVVQQNTATTVMVSTSSSTSSSESNTTQTVITTSITSSSTTHSLSSTSSGSTTDLANSSGTKSWNGGTSTSEYTTDTYTVVLQPSSSFPQSKSTSRTPVIIGSVIGATVGISLLIGVVLLIFLMRRHIRHRRARLLEHQSEPLPFPIESPHAERHMSTAKFPLFQAFSHHHHAKLADATSSNEAIGSLPEPVMTMSQSNEKAPPAVSSSHAPSTSPTERQIQIQVQAEHLTERIEELAHFRQLSLDQDMVPESLADALEEISRLRVQVRYLNEQIHLDWALGLTDEPPPAYLVESVDAEKGRY